MTNTELPTEVSRPAQYILHPTDFSDNSHAALAHALRLALSNKATLDLLHVGNDTDEGWDEFPSIRKVLESWAMIPSNASQSDVLDLGIEIEKTVYHGKDVAESIENYCQRRPIDMIVLATAGRDGLMSWFMPSKAERVANKVSNLSIPTLFVPKKAHGCVDVQTGNVMMNHVLVPVDHEPASDEAVERGLRAIATFGSDNADLTLLHVGSESSFPQVHIPDGPWNIKRVVREGNPAAEILSAAKKVEANLIIMVTDGEHGFLDALRGTTTEQVLRHAPCPVLAVPTT